MASGEPEIDAPSEPRQFFDRKTCLWVRRPAENHRGMSRDVWRRPILGVLISWKTIFILKKDTLLVRTSISQTSVSQRQLEAAFFKSQYLRMGADVHKTPITGNIRSSHQAANSPGSQSVGHISLKIIRSTAKRVRMYHWE